MEHNNQETLDGRLVAAMLQVGDLDAMQSIFVSNEIADASPRLQRSILNMIQAERTRRDAGEQPAGFTIPDFLTWPTADLLAAGMVIITGSETAALTGNPELINFSFRLLQSWFVAEGRRYTEEKTNA